MFLFIHIPRTAGTTFSDILKKNFKEKYIRVYGMKKRDFFSDEEVKALAVFFPDAECISAHEFACPLPQPDNSNTNKIIQYQFITFLREPVARAFSHYFYNRERWRKGIIKKDFVEELFPIYFKKTNEQAREISGGRWVYLADMQTYILDRNYNLEAAKNRMKNEFFFVGVTERFEESLIILRRKIREAGINFRIGYFKKNVSLKKKPEPDPETYNMVLAENRRDKELYDYANFLLDEEIKKYQGDFKKDLAVFQKRQKFLSHFAFVDNFAKKAARVCLRFLNKRVYVL